MVVHLHSGINLFAKFSILNVWQCSEYDCLDNCSVICTVILFTILAYSTVFSGICQHVQLYSALFRNIDTYGDIIKAYLSIFKFIQAYSAPCVTLTYSQTCHILRHGIFRTEGLLKTLWNIDQAYSEPCHRASLSHIQAQSEPYVTLAYAETWHSYRDFSKHFLLPLFGGRNSIFSWASKLNPPFFMISLTHISM